MARLRLRRAVAATLMASGLAMWWPEIAGHTRATSPPAPPLAAASELTADAAAPGLEAPACHERPLGVPTGLPPRLSCAEARAIVAEVESRFAGDRAGLELPQFSKLLQGWLDPHGLWSAAPDAPTARALRRHAPALLAELRASPSASQPCSAALTLGGQLADWVRELSRVYDAARVSAPLLSPEREHRRFRESIFQDDPVTRPGRELARSLGRRIGEFGPAHPERAPALEGVARDRYLPSQGASEWSEVVLAAAVRAYVPALDVHGQWAPFEEEWSLYHEDPALAQGPRLWGEIQRTALGVRILREAVAPLQVGDLVLAVDSVATTGMPLEQVEQLGRLEPQGGTARRVLLLRGGRDLREVAVELGGEADPASSELSLESERVRFGQSWVLVVRIQDVPDGLGDALGGLFAEANADALSGVLLDLRGNGGGSTDGAAAALGTVLPGAPLFPLSARGRLVEVMRASTPPLDQRWAGPFAVLVDGYTASAAEMIAGATLAYARGPVLGARTFGKGCIQEYADDHVGRGVLRVTTFLFASPDGSAVQRTGLLPNIALPLSPVGDHESDAAGALLAYTGPDVRDARSHVAVPWPSHTGEVGPCADKVICSALQRLSQAPASARVARARRVSRPVATGSFADRP